MPADHPDKTKEIGAEATPAAFLDTLLALTAEWGRVLAPHGSICVELGDTYSGSGMGGGDWIEGSGSLNVKHGGHKPDIASMPVRRGAGWPLAKSMVGIPHLYHLSLAYGRNILTGEPSPAGQWRIRNVVAWCRPNPPVGALGDKFRPATSYLTVATKATDRYFDLDACRTPHKADPTTYSGNGYTKGNPSGAGENNAMPGNPAGAPPLDHWNIPTHPYAGAHYACFPPALCETPIKAMVPLRVCRTCGQPSRRITDDRRVDARGNQITGDFNAHNWKPGEGYVGEQGSLRTSDGKAIGTIRETLGWTDCGHGDNWRNGRVLDPFGGSGTVGQVATGHGRDALLIDLDERNVELAEQRVGPLMFRHVTATEAAVWLDEPVGVGEVG